jgi:hypothetical protein
MVGLRIFAQPSSTYVSCSDASGKWGMLFHELHYHPYLQTLNYSHIIDTKVSQFECQIPIKQSPKNG